MEKPEFAFRCLAYQEKNRSFTGVCLDLDIVEEEHETLQEAVLSLNDAIASHVQAAAKFRFPKELMFRPAPKEYWDKLNQIKQAKPQKLPFIPFQVFSFQPHIADLAYA